MSDRPVERDEAPVRRRPRRKKTPWQKFKEAYLPLVLVLLAIILVVSLIVGVVKLIAGSGKKPAPVPTDTTPSETEPVGATPAEVQAALNQAEILAGHYDYDGAVDLLNSLDTDDTRIPQAISDYSLQKQTLVLWEDNTEVPMVSFQPMIVDTDRAFDGDDKAGYYNRNCLTLEEFRAILEQLYEGGYVLISPRDLAGRQTDGSFGERELYLPAEKKPIIFSLVPAHYTALQAGDGFARRLTLDNTGKVTSEYVDTTGTKNVGTYDFVTVLDEFVNAHPDFSYHGFKAILALSGDECPLGYKLTDTEEASQAKRVAQALTAEGYTFASFTYDGIRYGDNSDQAVKDDVNLWVNTYKPVLGEVDILIYAGGSDLEKYEGEKYETLYGAGFRYFCGMDNNVTSWVKITENYLRIDRRTITGTRITEDAKLVADLFDAKSVRSSQRPK